MQVVKCESCGAPGLRIENGYYVCDYCGSKFLIQKKDMPGGVTAFNTGLDSDVERLLEKCKSNPERAKKYANLILEIDPFNKEAKKYL